MNSQIALRKWGSNFRFPEKGTEPFLTESLILAQNERWRRG
jgi:hypothetical protein